MITILMAAFNGERYIGAQIESIIQQTFTDWRLLIQDDCSADATVKAAEKYAAKFPTKIIVCSREEPSGSAASNFSSMLPLAAGSDYIMFCDDDDVWEPDKIELTFGKMRELENQYGYSTPLLVHTDLKVVDSSLVVHSESMFRKQKLDDTRTQLNYIFTQNIVTGCSMMINRPLYEKVDRVPTKAVMHDWWFALIAAVFGHIGFVNQSTVLYRQHEKNEIGAKDAGSIRYNFRRFSHTAQAKAALYRSFAQAGEFLICYGTGISGEQKNLISAYAGIPENTKIKRLFLLFHFRFWKKGFFRKLGQIIFV